MADETTNIDLDDGSIVLQDWLNLLEDSRGVKLASFAAPSEQLSHLDHVHC